MLSPITFILPAAVLMVFSLVVAAASGMARTKDERSTSTILQSGAVILGAIALIMAYAAGAS